MVRSNLEDWTDRIVLQTWILTPTKHSALSPHYLPFFVKKKTS
jgi:hypothetical protein